MPPKDSEFKGFGFGFKNAPQWALGIFICALAVWLLMPSVSKILDPEGVLVRERAVNEAFKVRALETMKHIGEMPTKAVPLVDDSRGKISLQVYGDNCIIPSAWKADGTFAGSTIIMDMLNDPDQHASFSLMAPLFAATVADSHCNYVNHGDVIKYGPDQQRNNCEIQMHYLFRDGCEMHRWEDKCHGLYAQNEWLVCKH